MSTPPHVLLLWVGLMGAALTDLSSGRIPNWLTLTMMVLGISAHALTSEPWLGVVGCLAAFALHFVLFGLGVVKAGDAKLMMGVGACVGMVEMLETTVWWMLLYLPLGLIVLAARGRLGNFVAALRYTADRTLGRPVGDPPEPTMMIAGPVIAVAGILASTTDVWRNLWA